MPQKRRQPSEKVKASRKAAEERIDAVAGQAKKTHKSLLLSTSALGEIRVAYKKGKKTVTLSGREFKIKRRGKYLLVQPKDGKLPVANVQLENGPSEKLKRWAEQPVERPTFR